MKPLTVLACALCLAGGVFWYGSSQRKAGLQEGRLEALTQLEKVAKQAVAKTDTVLVHTRDTLRQVRRIWDSLKVTDTIPVFVAGVPESVIVYVPRAAADTAVSMCLRTLSACDASLRARDSLLVLKDRHIRGLEAMKSKRCKIGFGPSLGGGVDHRGRPTLMAGASLALVC